MISFDEFNELIGLQAIVDAESATNRRRKRPSEQPWSPLVDRPAGLRIQPSDAAVAPKLADSRSAARRTTSVASTIARPASR